MVTAVVDVVDVVGWAVVGWAVVVDGILDEADVEIDVGMLVDGAVPSIDDPQPAMATTAVVAT